MFETKYYIPTIEEFHVDFEYQIMNIENSMWGKYIHKYDDRFLEDLENKFIRVKILDEQAILDCNFIIENIPNVFSENDEIVIGYSLNIDKNNTLFLYKENAIIKIVKQTIYNEITGNWVIEVLFQGIIKNKSEFKKLLTQINYKL